MALINDPDNLSQGAETAVSDAAWGSPTGRQVTITSAGSNLPAISAGDYFAVRDHSSTQNNGLYKETGGSPTTGSITADKVTGSAPVTGGAEAVRTFGSTTTPLNIFYDLATREVALLEQNGLSADGVVGNTVYSKMMIDWKDDADLIGQVPFPMLMIDRDAGKAFIGQDAAGNNSGWTWFDDATYSVRTRKLLRNLGWTEINSDASIEATYFCAITLGVYEDPANDTAYYQFGSDATVDDTVDFDFAGPVNESVSCYQRLSDGSINGGTGVAISTDGRTLTRSDGGNWRTDGFKVGGRILLRNAENATSDGDPSVVYGGGAFLLSAVGTGVDGAVTVGTAADAGTGFNFVDGGGGNDSVVRNDGGSWLTEGYFVGGALVVANATTVANDGTYTILSVTETTVEVATASFTADTGDNTATFGPINPTGTPDTTVDAAVDNRNGVTLRLRVRDADPTGKTYSQADLSTINKTELGNLVFSFPLANASDLKITETDANIDANTPYTGMSITFYSTPQSLGGGGGDALVGGPYNFGIVVDANNGTNAEAHEFVQRQLRKLTDIDAGAGTVVGRAADGLVGFVGDTWNVGTPDNGVSFPNNPLGGGSGVMVTNLDAGSKNDTRVYDNTGTQRGFPVGTPVTLDFNQILIDDTLAKYTLLFDRTIRTVVSDLVINAGTGATGTFTSAGSNLPASLDAGVGAYVRISGLTGADAAMNGVYQVTSISAASCNVTRYDSKTIVTTTVASLNLDQHTIDSPDEIIVQDNVPANVTGLANADYSFTFDYSNNVQGGRTASTDAQVVCRAIGQSGAQFAQSSVQTIQSGIALVIPVSAVAERNFQNN